MRERWQARCEAKQWSKEASLWTDGGQREGGTSQGSSLHPSGITGGAVRWTGAERAIVNTEASFWDFFGAASSFIFAMGGQKIYLEMMARG